MKKSNVGNVIFCVLFFTFSMYFTPSFPVMYKWSNQFANFHAQLENREYGRDCACDTLQIIHLFPMWGEALLQHAIGSIMAGLQYYSYSSILVCSKTVLQKHISHTDIIGIKPNLGSLTDEVEHISLKQP